MNILFDLTNTLANALSPTAWMIILVIVVVLFGGAKIPELMKGVGKGMSEFKKGVEEGKSDSDKKEDDSEDKSKKA